MRTGDDSHATHLADDRHWRLCASRQEVGAAVVGSSALLVLLSAAVMLGVVLQALGNSRMYARWPATALASAVGGYAASELVGALSAGAWEWDGLAVVPGVLGVVITGALVDVVLRKYLPDAI